MFWIKGIKQNLYMRKISGIIYLVSSCHGRRPEFLTFCFFPSSFSLSIVVSIDFLIHRTTFRPKAKAPLTTTQLHCRTQIASQTSITPLKKRLGKHQHDPLAQVTSQERSKTCQRMSEKRSSSAMLQVAKNSKPEAPSIKNSFPNWKKRIF